MSVDLVLKGLDLVAPELQLIQSTSSRKVKSKKPKEDKKDEKVTKKRFKSEIEREVAAKKKNFLKHNLTYMQHMADRQCKPSEMNKMITAHRRNFTNWRELEAKSKVKRKKSTKSVFDEADFQRWAADLVPKQPDLLLS